MTSSHTLIKFPNLVNDFSSFLMVIDNYFLGIKGVELPPGMTANKLSQPPMTPRA